MREGLSLSAAAAAQMKVLQEKQGKPDLMLRLVVDGGGCSGFRYSFEFTDEAAKEDLVFETDGVKLITDETSLQFLAGAQVDFKRKLIGSAFVINNPNAASSCGCGSSFSI